MFYNTLKILPLFLGLSLAQLVPFDNILRKEFVTSFGFPFETHSVTTIDGYILAVDRIPYGRTSLPVNGTTRPVVFLMHETWGDSSTWIIKGPTQGLAFLLAEKGFDVWMGNNRGSINSRRHTNLTPLNPAFWSFTLQELAVLDLPAMFKYVLTISTRANLTYIGHSQGATIYFILASENPAATNVVNMAVTIAPTVYMSHTKSKIKIMASQLDNLKGLSRTFGVYDLTGMSMAAQGASRFFCKQDSYVLPICKRLIASIYGPSHNDYYEAALLPKIFPMGSSINIKWQLLQYIQTGKFAKFDYGAEQNQVLYGSVTPPLYDLRRVVNNTVLFYGTKDWMATPEDVIMTFGQVPSSASTINIAVPDYNHLDLLWGDNVEVFYQNLINVIQ